MRAKRPAWERLRVRRAPRDSSAGPAQAPGPAGAVQRERAATCSPPSWVAGLREARLVSAPTPAPAAAPITANSEPTPATPKTIPNTMSARTRNVGCERRAEDAAGEQHARVAAVQHRREERDGEEEGEADAGADEGGGLALHRVFSCGCCGLGRSRRRHRVASAVPAPTARPLPTPARHVSRACAPRRRELPTARAGRDDTGSCARHRARRRVPHPPRFSRDRACALSRRRTGQGGRGAGRLASSRGRCNPVSARREVAGERERERGERL